RSDTAFTASNPFAHSATTSMPGIAARYSRTTARASSSSSTIATLSGTSGTLLIGDARQVQLDPELFRAGVYVHARGTAERGSQTAAHVVETHSAGSGGAGVRLARVFETDRAVTIAA